MAQLSIFDLDQIVEDINNEPKATPVQPVITPTPPTPKQKVVKPVKPVLSQSLLDQLDSIEGIDDLCRFMATDTIYLEIGENYRRQTNGYTVDYRGARTAEYSSQLKEDHFSAHIHIRSGWEHDEKQVMVFFDKEGNAWCRPCNIKYLGGRIGENEYHPSKWDMEFSWEGKWRLLTSLPTDKIVFLQTYHVRSHIFHDAMPYTFKYSRDENSGKRFSQDLLMMCPQIELLDKAGYKFVDQLTYYPNRIDNETVTAFNRLIKFERNPGKLQNIFKTTKEVCKILKNEHKLEVWNSIRKLEKFSKSSPDEIQVVYDNHYRERELANIQNILQQQYHNKNVFTFSSLVNYLNRLDQYEAIGTEEALQLLKDYLESCRLLDMEPRIDGDSLKREHDVAARLVRERRNEIEAERMANGCKKLQQYNYENERYIIRGIRDYEDLLDEAKQQHNCVASYSHKIAAGTSLIFVMRRKTVPDRSFVTIELSPDLSTVRQKYEAHNQPLRNKEATEFIEEWQKHCKDVAKGKVNPHILAMDLEKAALAALVPAVDNVDAAIKEAFENDNEIDI